MTGTAELADLYLTLRAVNAPLLSAFTQSATAGEEMVTALSASLAELDAMIARTAESLVALRGEMAGVGATGLTAGTEGLAATAAAESTGAAGVAAMDTGALAAGTGTATAAADETVAAYDRVLAEMAKVSAEAATVQAETDAFLASQGKVAQGLAAGMATAATGVTTAESGIAAGAASAAGTYVDAQGRMRDAQGQFVADTTSAETTVSRSYKSMGSSALSLGGLLHMAFGNVELDVAELGTGTVLLASKFQTQMTRLYTAAGAPKDAVLANSNAILSLATSVGMTGDKMAEALYHPISAGLDLATSLQVVKYAAEEATISGASLDDTTYSLSSVMKAFNQPASQAGQTMADLNAIVGEGDMRFQDFNESVKNWAPTAAQMGIGINSMGAGLAYLTDRGNSAEVAATRMTMGISMMTTPSAQAAKLLEGLGVASSDVAASTSAMTDVLKKTGITQNKLAEDLKQPDGLYVALKDLKDGLEKAGVKGTEADSVLAKIFGGGRSDKAIMSLMQNLDGLKDKFDAISKDSTPQKFEQNWEDAKKTFSFQMQQMKAAAENSLTHIGLAVLPKLSAFIDDVKSKGGQAIHDFMQGFRGDQSDTSGLAKIGGIIHGVIDDLKSFGRDASTAFKNLWSAAGPTAKMLGGELLGALMVVGGLLKNVVGPALVAVSGFFKDHQGILMALVQMALIPLTLKLAGLPFKAVAGAASGFFGIFKNSYKAIADTVKVIGGIGKGIGKVASKLADGGKAVGKFASDLVGGLKNSEDAADTFGGKVGGIMKGAGKVLGDAMAAVKAGGKAMAAVMVETVWPALVSAATATWSFTVALLANPITWIVIGLIALGVAIYLLVTHWSTVEKFLKGAWSAFISWGKDVWKNVASFFSDLWHDVSGFFTDIWNDIVNWVKSVWHDAVQGAKNIWNDLTGFFKGLWDKITQGVKDGWNAISSFVTSIPGKIGGFFSDAINWLYDHGKAILEGFLNGLKDAWRHVTDFVGGIGSWIAAHKGPIEVDRELLKPHGAAIMGGFLGSLQQGAGQVLSYLDDFTRDIAATGSGALTGDLSISGPSSPSLGSLVVSGGATLAASTLFGSSAAPTVIHLGGITVQGSVVTEQDLIKSVQKGILQLSARNPGFGTNVAFA